LNFGVIKNQAVLDHHPGPTYPSSDAGIEWVTGRKMKLPARLIDSIDGGLWDTGVEVRVSRMEHFPNTINNLIRQGV